METLSLGTDEVRVHQGDIAFVRHFLQVSGDRLGFDVGVRDRRWPISELLASQHF